VGLEGCQQIADAVVVRGDAVIVVTAVVRMARALAPARSLPGANEGEVFGVIVGVVLRKAMCRRHLARACRLLEVGTTVGVLTPAGTTVEMKYLTAPRRGIVYRKVGEGTPQSLLQKLDA